MHPVPILRDEDQEQTWVVVRKRFQDVAFVEIVSDSQSGCATSQCGASGVGCQSNAFVGLFSSAPLLKIKDVPTEVSIGDRLFLSLPRSAVFQLAFLGYGLPLLTLLLGLWLGQSLMGDWGALAFGLCALLLTWWVIGRLGLDIEPKILEVQSVVI